MTKQHLILVNFGDNDFSNALQAFGNLLVNTRRDVFKRPFTKKEIVRFFNRTFLTLNEIVARNAPMPHQNTKKYQEHMTIDESQVFIDEEVERFLDINIPNSETLYVRFVKTPAPGDVSKHYCIV